MKKIKRVCIIIGVIGICIISTCIISRNSMFSDEKQYRLMDTKTLGMEYEEYLIENNIDDEVDVTVSYDLKKIKKSKSIPGDLASAYFKYVMENSVEGDSIPYVYFSNDMKLAIAIQKKQDSTFKITKLRYQGCTDNSHSKLNEEYNSNNDDNNETDDGSSSVVSDYLDGSSSVVSDYLDGNSSTVIDKNTSNNEKWTIVD